MDRKAPLAHQQGEDQRLRGAGVEQGAQREGGRRGQRREDQHRFEAEAPDERRCGRFDPDIADEHRRDEDPGVQRIPAEAVLEHQRQQEGHGTDGQAVDEPAGGRGAERPGAKRRPGRTGGMRARRIHQTARDQEQQPGRDADGRQAAGLAAAGQFQAHHDGPTPRVVRASPSQSRRRARSPAVPGPAAAPRGTPQVRAGD